MNRLCKNTLMNDVWILLLCCVPVSVVSAHGADGDAHGVQGHGDSYTDTSIHIAKPGVRVLYTLSEQRLNDLARRQSKLDQTHEIVPSLSVYKAIIEQGWSVSSGSRDCDIKQSKHSVIDKTRLFQFEIVFECQQGLNSINIDYRLFDAPLGAKDKEHYNAVRVLMAGQELKTRLAHDQRRIPVDVKGLTRMWKRELADALITKDPNKDKTWRTEHVVWPDNTVDRATEDEK